MYNDDAARFLAMVRPLSQKVTPQFIPRILAPNASFQEILIHRAERLKRYLTPSEEILQRKLRQANLSFWDQQIIGWYIVDMLLPDRMIIVEVDGNIHHQTVRRIRGDKRRTKWLESFGFKIVRISNERLKHFSMDELLTAPIHPIDECTNAVAKANRERDMTLVERRHTPAKPPVRKKKVIRRHKPHNPKRRTNSLNELHELNIHLDLALFYDRS